MCSSSRSWAESDAAHRPQAPPLSAQPAALGRSVQGGDLIHVTYVAVLGGFGVAATHYGMVRTSLPRMCPASSVVCALAAAARG
jgi:hypothetical protein